MIDLALYTFSKILYGGKKFFIGDSSTNTALSSSLGPCKNIAYSIVNEKFQWVRLRGATTLHAFQVFCVHWESGDLRWAGPGSGKSVLLGVLTSKTLLYRQGSTRPH